MEKSTVFTPAFDKRSKEAIGDYGVHGVDLKMVLKGKLGMVYFTLYTNWHLPHIDVVIKPLPAYSGYHSLKPQYNDQTISCDKCGHLNDKPCYHGQSTTYADEIYVILLEKGSEGVWKELEKYYIKLFKKLR